MYLTLNKFKESDIAGKAYTSQAGKVCREAVETYEGKMSSGQETRISDLGEDLTV